MTILTIQTSMLEMFEDLELSLTIRSLGALG